MKQTYKVHCSENLTTNKKYGLINITVPEVDTCPCCGIATSPTFIDGFIIKHPDWDRLYCYVALYCPKCRAVYTAIYTNNIRCYGLDNMYLESVFPKIANKVSFSNNIVELSPEFVSLYNQASRAEEIDEVNGLTGLGYRKSLEFLIKDFLIKIQNQDRDTIIKMELGNCVNKLPERLQDIAKASIWLANDEVHYFRKNPEYDIDDLKAFIDCLIHFIEVEYTYNKAKKLVNK